MHCNVALSEMPRDLKDKAVQAALEGKWEDAAEFNLALINEGEKSLATLNRLGRAYIELGKIDEAKETYKQVLDLDKFNPIAKKNLKRIKAKQKTKGVSRGVKITPPINANFLEEPGKTKTSQLVRLADADVIASLSIGQSLNFESRRRSVCGKTEDGTYIGSLPDDLSLRLGKLLKGGNKYEVLIKSIVGHAVQIFIRETKRSLRLKDTPSFPSTSSTSYYADIRHAMLNEDPVDTRETGDEQDF